MPEQDRWSKIGDHFASLNEGWLNAFYAFSTLLIGASFSFINKWTAFGLFIGPGAALLVYSIVATAVRSRQAAAASGELYLVLDKGLGPLVRSVARMVSTSSAPERRMQAAQIKVSAVAAASALVGRSKEGTRANIFKLQNDETGARIMKLDPNCSAGRGDESDRVFTEGHPTMTATLANKMQFIERVDASEAGQLRYETYITYPIAGSDGTIYGVLTVDCLHSGELDGMLDRPAMRIIAAIAACAYACA